MFLRFAHVRCYAIESPAFFYYASSGIILSNYVLLMFL